MRLERKRERQAKNKHPVFECFLGGCLGFGQTGSQHTHKKKRRRVERLKEPHRASFSKRSFRAWLLCVTRRVRWLGKFWYRLEMICTATSVLPVPGGPTTMVRPGCIPDRMARTAQKRRGRRKRKGTPQHRNGHKRVGPC